MVVLDGTEGYQIKVVRALSYQLRAYQKRGVWVTPPIIQSPSAEDDTRYESCFQHAGSGPHLSKSLTLARMPINFTSDAEDRAASHSSDSKINKQYYQK